MEESAIRREMRTSLAFVSSVLRAKNIGLFAVATEAGRAHHAHYGTRSLFIACKLEPICAGFHGRGGRKKKTRQKHPLKIHLQKKSGVMSRDRRVVHEEARLSCSTTHTKKLFTETIFKKNFISVFRVTLHQKIQTHQRLWLEVERERITCFLVRLPFGTPRPSHAPGRSYGACDENGA